MGIIKNVIIVVFSLFTCVLVQADQAQLVSQKQATAALHFLTLQEIKVIKKLCTPCGDQRAQNIIIDTMSVQDGHYKGLWQLVINGQPVDLAYHYVPTQGRWKNFARVVDIYVEDMPKYLGVEAPQQQKGANKGWFVSKGNRVMTQDIKLGVFIALLGLNQDKRLSIFFQGLDKKSCADPSLSKSHPIPMYINDTLVKFTQLCQGDWLVLFAETPAGNDFVIEQFKQQEHVKFRPYSGESDFIFSSKGFVSLYKQVKMQQPSR